MARRRRQRSGGGMGAWVQGVGEQLGVQLGQIIAESLQRSLESSINVADIAKRLGAGTGGGRGGRQGRGGGRGLFRGAGCGGPRLPQGPFCFPHHPARDPGAKARALPPRTVPTVSGVPPAADTDTESTRAIDTELLARALRQSKEEGAPGGPKPQAGDQPSWFALIANKQEGPLSKAELALKTAQGTIGPRTYLLREGMADWVRAKDVPEAAGFFDEPPPPTRQPTPVGVAPAVNATPG